MAFTGIILHLMARLINEMKQFQQGDFFIIIILILYFLLKNRFYIYVK